MNQTAAFYCGLASGPNVDKSREFPELYVLGLICNQFLSAFEMFVSRLALKLFQSLLELYKRRACPYRHGILWDRYRFAFLLQQSFAQKPPYCGLNFSRLLSKSALSALEAKK